MTKVISLGNNQPPPQIPTKNWAMTFMTNGFFYSGSAKCAHIAFIDFTAQAIPIYKTIEHLEETNNKEIIINIARSEFIDKKSLYKPSYNQKIIQSEHETQNLLFTINPATSGELEEIWMDQMMNSDDYEEIGDRISAHGQALGNFIDNMNHALTCEMQVHGLLEDNYLNSLHKAVREITAFEIEEYQEYLYRADPTETFEFMGLKLQPTACVVTKLHIIN